MGGIAPESLTHNASSIASFFAMLTSHFIDAIIFQEQRQHIFSSLAAMLQWQAAASEIFNGPFHTRLYPGGKAVNILVCTGTYLGTDIKLVNLLPVDPTRGDGSAWWREESVLL